MSATIMQWNLAFDYYDIMAQFSTWDRDAVTGAVSGVAEANLYYRDHVLADYQELSTTYGFVCPGLASS